MKNYDEGRGGSTGLGGRATRPAGQLGDARGQPDGGDPAPRSRDASAAPTRRDFIALGVGAFVVASLPAALRRRPRLVRRRIPVMGTVGEVAVVHQDPAHAQRAIGAALDELVRVESVLTRFRGDSDVGRANRGAASGPVEVSAETAKVVRSALEWAHATGGAFDPALGRAVALWDPAATDTPPPTAAFSRFAGRELYRGVEVGSFRGSSVIRFADADVALDLGGIGKGYGVDRAVAVLRDWGVTRGLVNLGGDLFALGTSEDGDPWKVGVRSPSDPGRLLTTLRVEDEAVATSGDYERFFEHGGVRYHHLLDPGSGAPRRGGAHSITTLAGSCEAADAAATAAFGLPLEEARRFLAGIDRGVRVAGLRSPVLG